MDKSLKFINKDDKEEYYQKCEDICSCFGVDVGKLDKSNFDALRFWIVEKGYDIELIKAACKLTLEKISQPSFPYTGTILRNWEKDGVTCVDQLPYFTKRGCYNNDQNILRTVDTEDRTYFQQAVVNYIQEGYTLSSTGCNNGHWTAVLVKQ